MDLKSIEILARKKMTENQVQVATGKYLRDVEGTLDPSHLGCEMTRNRPVTIGFLSPLPSPLFFTRPGFTPLIRSQWVNN
jgi:hypothetical protein